SSPSPHCARAPSRARARCRRTRGTHARRRASRSRERGVPADYAAPCDSRGRARSERCSRAANRRARCARRASLVANSPCAPRSRARCRRRARPGACACARAGACTPSRRGAPPRATRRGGARRPRGRRPRRRPWRSPAHGQAPSLQPPMRRESVPRGMSRARAEPCGPASIIARMRSPDERPAKAIYSAAQVRELDRRASAELGVPSFELMSRAGAEAFRLLRERWPDARAIVVLCGAGNNAGDGLVLARHAKAAGLELRVLAVAPPERLEGDAKRALEECVAVGIKIERFAKLERPADAGRTLVVDALLGIGADRPLAGDFAAAVAE